MSSFSCPTKVLAGLGSLTELGPQLDLLGAQRSAIVVDRAVVEIGLLDHILTSAGRVPHVAVLPVAPNPDIAAVEEAADAALVAGADTVLAIGGGSALGVGKAVAIRLTNSDVISSYEGVSRFSNAPAPTVAVPTTAGSGSEVSNALVLHEAGRDQEIVIRGPHAEPRLAVLDATVLRGLPDRPMLEAALDALTHAFEALWARGRSLFTDAVAVYAARTIMQLLPHCLAEREPADLQRLLEASCAANIACGNSGLGLVHALSCAPSIRLTHGYQNGVLLPHVAEFNRSVLDVEHRPLLDELADLYAELGVNSRFSVGEISDVEPMLRASRDHPFRLNNARASSDDELRAVLFAAGVPGGEFPERSDQHADQPMPGVNGKEN